MSRSLAREGLVFCPRCDQTVPGSWEQSNMHRQRCLFYHIRVLMWIKPIYPCSRAHCGDSLAIMLMLLSARHAITPGQSTALVCHASRLARAAVIVRTPGPPAPPEATSPKARSTAQRQGRSPRSIAAGPAPSTASQPGGVRSRPGVQWPRCRPLPSSVWRNIRPTTGRIVLPLPTYNSATAPQTRQGALSENWP